MRTHSIFYYLFSFLSLGICLVACQTTSTENNQTVTPKVQLPEILKKALIAHGGLDQWNKMQTLEYTIQKNEKPERHQIDLKNRKVLDRPNIEGFRFWIEFHLSTINLLFPNKTIKWLLDVKYGILFSATCF